MKVYVILDGVDYEGEDIVAIRSTLEGALEQAEALVADKDYGDYLKVVESNVDMLHEKYSYVVQSWEKP